VLVDADRAETEILLFFFILNQQFPSQADLLFRIFQLQGAEARTSGKEELKIGSTQSS
jgi:hypothetical protein